MFSPQGHFSCHQRIMPLFFCPLACGSLQYDGCNRVVASSSVCLTFSIDYKNGLVQASTLSKLIIALTHKQYIAVSINFNATSSPLPASDNSYSTLTHLNVSMCQVEQNGLGPGEGGPRNPDAYSTACSCSDLVHSFVSGYPVPIDTSTPSRRSRQ